eukprot:scaffold11314_cov58-Phaeocystis_antarctica.AAC.3
MQAGVPPCSLQRSTQWNSEVERSGGTRKQLVLAGEEVQPVGQTAGAAGGRKRTAVAVSTRTPSILRKPVSAFLMSTSSSKRLVAAAAATDTQHLRRAPVGSCMCVADVPLYLGALLSRCLWRPARWQRVSVACFSPNNI